MIRQFYVISLFLVGLLSNSPRSFSTTSAEHDDDDQGSHDHSNNNNNDLLLLDVQHVLGISWWKEEELEDALHGGIKTLQEIQYEEVRLKIL